MNIQEKLFYIQQNLKAPKGQYNKFGDFHYRSCEDIARSGKAHSERGESGAADQ